MTLISEWTQNPWFALSGWILGIAGISLTVHFGMKSLRRAKIGFHFRPTRLIPEDMTDIEVLFNGERITEPWLLDITLRNQGGEDLSSNDFDKRRDLKILLGAEMVGTVYDPDLQLFCSDARTVVVEPQTIPVGDKARATVLVSGQPNPTFSGRIPKIELRNQPIEGSYIMPRSAIQLWMALSTVSSASGLVLLILHAGGVGDSEVLAGSALFCALGITFPAATLAYSILLSRPDLRRRVTTTEQNIRLVRFAHSEEANR